MLGIALHQKPKSMAGQSVSLSRLCNVQSVHMHEEGPNNRVLGHNRVLASLNQRNCLICFLHAAHQSSEPCDLFNRPKVVV